MNEGKLEKLFISVESVKVNLLIDAGNSHKRIATRYFDCATGWLELNNMA